MPCDAITSVLCIFLLIVIAFREKSVQRPDRKPPFCANSYQLLFVCTVLILEHFGEAGAMLSTDFAVTVTAPEGSRRVQ